MVVRNKAGLIITVSRSHLRDQIPEEILDFHREQRAWWSSAKDNAAIWKGMPVFVRFAGTNEIIGRAWFRSDCAKRDPNTPDDDLPWRYEVEFGDRPAVRGVYLRDFGVTGGRARPGLIGLTSGERDEIDAALDGAGRK